MPGRQSFPRSERLTLKRDFERIHKQGIRVSGNAFVCYAVRLPGQGRKLGCAISRKVGAAVVRNRVKRYIREMYRTHRAEIADDVQMVIVAKPDSATLDYHDCERALRQLLQKGLFLNGQAP